MPRKPSWEALFATAVRQDGLFGADQVVTVPEVWRWRRIGVPDAVAIADRSPEGIRDVLERARKGGVVEPADMALLERSLSIAEQLLHSGRVTY